jgi:hypothetical protein
MSGPALGGFLFERVGFGRLTLFWSVWLFAAGLVFARMRVPADHRPTLDHGPWPID